MTFLKTNFQFLVLVAIALLFFFTSVFQKTPTAQPIIHIHSDTTDRAITGTHTTQPVLVQTIPYPVDRYSVQYLPDTSYAGLKAQFEKLVAEYLATNVQKDSIQIDSLGTVKATISTSKNKVDSVKWDYNLRERTITNTITIKEPYKPRNQLSVGGGISATPQLQITGLEAGILFKDKRDRSWGVKGEFNTQTPLPFSIGVTHYRPIKLRK